MDRITLKVFWRWLFLAVLVVMFALVIYFSRNEQSLALQKKADPQSNWSIGVKTMEGFSQVVIEKDKKEHFRTVERYNHRHPFLRDQYAVWINELSEENQVELYDTQKGERHIIATGRFMVVPKVSSDGRAVWQNWDGQGWLISYFDGHKVIELGWQGINPDLHENEIIFARRSVAGGWELIAKQIQTGTERILYTGYQAKSALLEGSILQSDELRIHLIPGQTVVSDQVKRPEETTPPRIINPETTPNEPDFEPGIPSRVPPGDEAIIEGRPFE